MIRPLLIAPILLFLVPGRLVAQSAEESPYGVLVMAHGGSQEWNRTVAEAVRAAEIPYEVEIAFGMADAVSLQDAVERLEARGVRRIGVVRLFISGESWTERTEQILGLVAGAPPRPTVPAPNSPGGHSMAFWRIGTRSDFVLSREGLADDSAIGAVLVDRVRAVSAEPAREDVLVLAHGPGDDAENERWLALIDQRSEAIRQALPFRRVQVMTLREDWPEKRESAQEAIRSFVARATAEGGRALVIPFRVQGLGPYAEVLEGLDYVADRQGLLPHAVTSEWIARTARSLSGGPFRTPLGG